MVMHYIGTFAGVSLVIFGVLYSLLGYNPIFQDKLIEYLTGNDTGREMKDESQLYGRRCYVPRENKRDVRINVYHPDNKTTLPVLFVCHGGSFTNGDADDTDEFCYRLMNMLPVCIISINYTKVSVHKTTYPQTEIREVITYVRRHCDEYHINKKKFAMLGMEAGGYLALLAGLQLTRTGILPSGYIFIDPYLDYVQTSLARAGRHPDPITLIAAGKDTHDFEEYAYELDRAGIWYESKIYVSQERGFLLHGESEDRDACMKLLKENLELYFR